MPRETMFCDLVPAQSRAGLKCPVLISPDSLETNLFQIWIYLIQRRARLRPDPLAPGQI